jgi:hypothetical protein
MKILTKLYLALSNMVLGKYQREFEKLANRVIGWPQKALIGTLLGGLKKEIATEVKMFLSKSFRKPLSNAECSMRDWCASIK